MPPSVPAVIDTVLPFDTADVEKLTVTDAKVTSSEPTFVTSVNKFKLIVADVEPSYPLFEAVNDPPIVRVFCEIFAVVVGAPTNDNE